MTPRLVILAGPLAGAAVVLDAAELLIGRVPECGLLLPGQTVSRRHAVLRREAEGMRLTDTDSLHGTFVNGLQVRDCLLVHGDQIAIGDSLLRFLDHEREADATAVAPDSSIEMVEAPDVPATLELPLAHAAYLRPLRAGTDAAGSALQGLLGLAASLAAPRDLEALGARIVTGVAEMVPRAARVALLVGADPARPERVFTSIRAGSPTVPFRLSRTVAERVFRLKAAVVHDDVGAVPDLADHASLALAQVTTLMCAPLIAGDEALGLLYLDASRSGVRFTPADLELVTAAAGLGALALRGLARVSRLEGENRSLRAVLDRNLVGESLAMSQVHEIIRRVAATDSTVLIRGESGTGKELVARAIHRLGPRSEQPFVALNCAAVPESLLESELFGHEKGAFTGATTARIGKIEAASGGTLFLDEIGDMAPLLQAKLLRALSERVFERLGGSRSVRADVRFLAATNRDLEQAIQGGSFRSDLYYRLAVVTIRIPPLRERKGDIGALAGHFAASLATRLNRRILGLTREAIAALEAYDWPGNVRELENAVERAIVLGDGEWLCPEDFPETVLEAGPPPSEPSAAGYHDAVRAARRQILLRAIAEAGGNLTGAAKRLGLNPTYLHRLLATLDLRGSLER